MHPNFPQSLHLHLADSVARQGQGIDPDGFIPEWHGYQPDPLGLWFVKRLEAVAERLNAVRARRANRLIETGLPDEACIPPASLAKEHGA